MEKMSWRKGKLTISLVTCEVQHSSAILSKKIRPHSVFHVSAIFSSDSLDEDIMARVGVSRLNWTSGCLCFWVCSFFFLLLSPLHPTSVGGRVHYILIHIDMYQNVEDEFLKGREDDHICLCCIQKLGLSYAFCLSFEPQSPGQSV